MDIIKRICYICYTIFRKLYELQLYLICPFFLTDYKGHIREKISSLQSKIEIVAFLFYTALLFTSTIIARFVANPYSNIIGHIMFFESNTFNYDGLMNTLMLVPYVFLYNLSFKLENALKRNLLLIISTSSFIELLQLLFWVGKFSIADLIHNVIGGIIGYIIWRINEYMKKRRILKRKERNIIII